MMNVVGILGEQGIDVCCRTFKGGEIGIMLLCEAKPGSYQERFIEVECFSLGWNES